MSDKSHMSDKPKKVSRSRRHINKLTVLNVKRAGTQRISKRNT